VQKSDFQEKIPENITEILFYQKTHGARRGDGERLGARLTTRGRGPGLATPTCCSAFFSDRLPLRRHHQKPRFRTRNSVLAPCRDWDLEEIFITIITDVSP
jgi:hypothetical protein